MWHCWAELQVRLLGRVKQLGTAGDRLNAETGDSPIRLGTD